MSKDRSIDDLSKEELLGLIYHQIPTTLTGINPCRCASCGESPNDDINITVNRMDGTVDIIAARVYWFICDQCEDDMAKAETPSYMSSYYKSRKKKVIL